jgi:hypothetical protein
MNLIQRIDDWISTVITDEHHISMKDAFAEAFVGLTADEPSRAVYDADRIVSLMVRDETLDYEEAVASLQSQISSMTFENAPIFINRFPEA